MNKSELINEIAEAAAITKVEAGKALAGFTSALQKTLKKGDTLSLAGFGSFSVKARAARTGRNPRTGEPLKIKASKVVKFKAAKNLSETVA